MPPKARRSQDREGNICLFLFQSRSTLGPRGFSEFEREASAKQRAGKVDQRLSRLPAGKGQYREDLRMKKQETPPKAHLLICTNQRPGAESCCQKVGGQEFFARMKEAVKDRGVRSSRWVTRTGCLGYCNDVGCVVALYRDDTAQPTLFSEVTASDFEPILDSLLK